MKKNTVEIVLWVIVAIAVVFSFFPWAQIPILAIFVAMGSIVFSLITLKASRKEKNKTKLRLLALAFAVSAVIWLYLVMKTS